MNDKACASGADHDDMEAWPVGRRCEVCTFRRVRVSVPAPSHGHWHITKLDGDGVVRKYARPLRRTVA